MTPCIVLGMPSKLNVWKRENPFETIYFAKRRTKCSLSFAGRRFLFSYILLLIHGMVHNVVVVHIELRYYTSFEAARDAA